MNHNRTATTHSLTHPLPAEYLLDYVAGTLSSGENLLIRSYIEVNPTQKQALEICESLCATLFSSAQATEEATISKDALITTLDKIDQIENTVEQQKDENPASTTHNDSQCAVLPPSLCRILDGTLDSVAWKKLGRGVEHAPLPPFADEPRTTTRLMRIQPNIQVSEHRHKGTEMTLVLAGGFEDQGTAYNRGDVSVISDETIKHNPISHAQEPCICLVVNTHGIELSSFWGKILNPFLRF